MPAKRPPTVGEYPKTVFSWSGAPISMSTMSRPKTTPRQTSSGIEVVAAPMAVARTRRCATATANTNTQ